MELFILNYERRKKERKQKKGKNHGENRKPIVHNRRIIRPAYFRVVAMKN